MLHPGLRTLLRLRVKGFMRKFGRSMRDPRKAVFLIVTYGFSLAFPLLFAVAQMVVPDSEFALLTYLEQHMAAVIAAVLYTVLFGAVFQFPVSYSLPEIQFLFTAPVSRSSMLLYKLLQLLGVGLYLAVIFGILLSGASSSWFNALLGAFLFSVMVTVGGVVVGLIAELPRMRRVLVVVFLAIGAGTVYSVTPVIKAAWAVRHKEDWDAVLALAQQTQAYRAAEFVVGPFTGVFGEPLFSLAFALSLAAVLAIIGVSLAVALNLNVNFYELSLNASARREAALDRMRQGKLRGGAWRPAARVKLPRLPRLGGAGAVLHRHLAAMMRERVVLWAVALFVMVPAAIGIVMQVYYGGEGVRAVARIVLGMSIYIAFLATNMVRFDFRADYSVLDHLKTLPIRPAALAAGTLIAPILFAFLLQVLPAVSFAVVTGAIAIPPVYLLFLLPMNALWFAVDNAFYLRAPSPTIRGMSPDPTVMGREFISMIAKGVLVSAIAGVAAGIYFGVRWAAGGAYIAIVATWVFVIPCVVWTVHLTGMAFRDLDLSRDRL